MLFFFVFNNNLFNLYFFRLISEKTIEENILKKANQKRLLGDLAIEGGKFTASFFKSVSIHFFKMFKSLIYLLKLYIFKLLKVLTFDIYLSLLC